MNEFIPKFVGQCLNFLSFFNTSLASKWALNLFSAPLKGRLKAPHPTLEKAKKEVFYYNNIPIQTYHWQGKKIQYYWCMAGKATLEDGRILFKDCNKKNIILLH